MEVDHDKLIEQFSAISGVDAERSKFYLESSAWNIEAALGSFYEDGDSEVIVAPEAPSVDSGGTDKKTGESMPKIGMDDSDESSEEEGQAFYAGGSEHSGQQVLGPSKKKKDVVSKLFKSAKEHGAEVLEDREHKGKGKKLTFSGTGYRLGESEDDHEVVDLEKPPKKPLDFVLKMWKTGFTVDDGPLREYEDPSNREFLNSVRRGQIPMELVRSARGGEVYINMEDHRHEEYVPEKPRRSAFSGSGHTLGSPAPTVVGQFSQSSTSASAASCTEVDNIINEGIAQGILNADSNQPSTNIQLRLPDGSRLVVKLNHSHTVGDIRQYVATARPNLASNFAIMTTFPHAELKDDSISIADAKLLNAALVIM